MTALDSWVRDEHTANGSTHDTYRKGSGPGVIVIHEIPGMTPEVIGFADELVERGYTVVMPHLFGTPGAEMGAGTLARSVVQVCVSKEFVKLRSAQTSPIAGWLRSLARELHAELGGPGVGALGMCFTGGFALAMMVDESVTAPVLAQPSLPFPVGRTRGADQGLDPADMDVVRRRVREGCPVLGLRYSSDGATGTRFKTLTAELGDAFIKVELEGKGHSTLTAHRQQDAVDAVMEFFGDRLTP
ncbi:MAG: dienelactone hydrolase family protein [Nocardioides sp.]|nr:dienelactone hydrolase family protein [Nocardioides sp.]